MSQRLAAPLFEFFLSNKGIKKSTFTKILTGENDQKLTCAFVPDVLKSGEQKNKYFMHFFETNKLHFPRFINDDLLRLTFQSLTHVNHLAVPFPQHCATSCFQSIKSLNLSHFGLHLYCSVVDDRQLKQSDVFCYNIDQCFQHNVVEPINAKRYDDSIVEIIGVSDDGSRVLLLESHSDGSKTHRIYENSMNRSLLSITDSTHRMILNRSGKRVLLIPTDPRASNRCIKLMNVESPNDTRVYQLPQIEAWMIDHPQDPLNSNNEFRFIDDDSLLMHSTFYFNGPMFEDYRSETTTSLIQLNHIDSTVTIRHL